MGRPIRGLHLSWKLNAEQKPTGRDSKKRAPKLRKQKANEKRLRWDWRDGSVKSLSRQHENLSLGLAKHTLGKEGEAKRVGRRTRDKRGVTPLPGSRDGQILVPQ